jgi:hypothetical protein
LGSSINIKENSLPTFFDHQHSSRPIKYQNLAYTGSASVGSTIFGTETWQIRVASDISGYVTIGDGAAVTATAQSGSMRIAANTEPEYFSVSPSQMIAFISTSSSSGNISITEMA